MIYFGLSQTMHKEKQLGSPLKLTSKILLLSASVAVFMFGGIMGTFFIVSGLNWAILSVLFYQLGKKLRVLFHTRVSPISNGQKPRTTAAVWGFVLAQPVTCNVYDDETSSSRSFSTFAQLQNS